MVSFINALHPRLPGLARIIFRWRGQIHSFSAKTRPPAEVPSHHEGKVLLNSALLNVARVFQTVGLVHITQEYLFEFTTTIGSSMVPTFSETGDVILYERLSYWFNLWRRGDVVIAASSRERDQRICKRIVGLPGDFVVSGGHYHIIPRGHVWLEGDNSFSSYDSRHYGPVPLGTLRGTVMWKFWPLHEFGVVRCRLLGSKVGWVGEREWALTLGR